MAWREILEAVLWPDSLRVATTVTFSRAKLVSTIRKDNASSFPAVVTTVVSMVSIP